MVVDFASIWTREGEFCDESIFEVNHLPGEYGGRPGLQAGPAMEPTFGFYLAQRIERRCV